MNLFLIYNHELIREESRFEITGDRAKQAISDHDLRDIKNGKEILAGVVNGQIGKACFSEISESRISGHFSGERDSPELLKIDLVTAICRPPTVRKVIKLAASFGVRSLSLVKTERTEKSYLSSHSLKDHEIDRELLLGLQQSAATTTPKVKIYPSLIDLLSSLEQNNENLRFFGDQQALNIRQALGDTLNEATIAIGPEAGWSSSEVASLQKHRFTAISLGVRSLRVEQACAALIGCFSMQLSPKENH